MLKKTIFSGVQPSGMLHLGNYLGSIKRWVEMEKSSNGNTNFIFMIADLHSITTAENFSKIHDGVLDLLSYYIACGLSPMSKSGIIFNQSAISFHSELTWILSCIAPLGWLQRMTQFKDKSQKQDSNVNLGLLSYPVLMASDILLYQANLVPVGEDQKQHLELTRDLAAKFNRMAGADIFTIPEPLIEGPAKRIASLQNAKIKMSKSSPDAAKHCIFLSDEDSVIVEKFKKATTDSIDNIGYDPENRPEVSNLLNIYSSLSGQSTLGVMEMYQGSGKMSAFKKDLSDLTISVLGPIRDNARRMRADKGYLINILKDNNKKAFFVANETFEKVRKVFSLGSRL